MTPITLPDAEAVTIAVLNDALAVPVSQTIPNPRPASFVVAFRTGGVVTEMVVDQAQMTIEAWSASAVEASTLAQSARTAIHAAVGTMVSDTFVAATEEFSGPAFLPDPESTQSRYTFSVLIALR